MLLRTMLVLTAVLGFCAPIAWADEARRSAQLAKMPVREVTVFKDGHALMLHEGKMPVEESGDVLMDYLPSPVLGTFWPYSADKGQADCRSGWTAEGAGRAHVAEPARTARRQCRRGGDRQ